MYECERLFGTERGGEVHEMVEAAIGRACPCKRGEKCPIAPTLEPGPVLLPLLPRTV